MKIIKYIVSAILLLLSIGQLLPIYLISSGLLLGQAEQNASYFIGKLIGHLLITILMLFFGTKLFKSARKNVASNENT